MEQYIQISKLNDFLYSPSSVYLHSIYEDFTGKVYKEKAQIEGTINHKNIDTGKYSTKKNIISGTSVYSKKYGIMGKIDVYDIEKGELIERKTKVKKMHQGYKIQLYAQYFCLKEMGYNPEWLFLRSLKDNKVYEIPIPGKYEERILMDLVNKIKNFKAEDLLKDKCDYYSGISIYSSLSW